MAMPDTVKGQGGIGAPPQSETSEICRRTCRRWIPRSSGRTPPQLDWPLAWLRQSPRRRPQVPGGCDGDRHTVGQLRTESVAAKFDFGTLMFTMEPGRHILEVRTICLYSFPCYAFPWPYLPLKHHSFYGSRVYIVKGLLH
jgi:hypothetical protein